MRRPIAALCLMLPLLGCALFESKQTKALRRSPDYHAGYRDGCASAGGPDANMREPAAQQRDDEMYAHSKAYRMGWGEGLGGCRSYTPQNAPDPGQGPIRDVNPGGGVVP